MTAVEAIKLFTEQMSDKIYNAPIDETAVNYLIDELKDVQKIVLDTYKSEKK